MSSVDDSIDQDLGRWMPRLVALWRQIRRSNEPARSPLTAAELAEAAAGVKRLSAGLTRDRPLVGEAYFSDPQLLGAYLLFYWPISYAQGRKVLAQLPCLPRSALDVGSGPGPLSAAALDSGAVEITAADQSEAALKIASTLIPNLKTRLWTAGALPAGRFDVVLFGHVLNELFCHHRQRLERRLTIVEQALGQLSQDRHDCASVVLLEPALRATSRELLELRDMLVARGAAVRAPCLYRGSCPALRDEHDWCHAEHPFTPPPEIDRIAALARLDKTTIKMSYLVLAPSGSEWPELPAGRLFRIVSSSLGDKGRGRLIGCGPEGRIGLTLLDKHVTEANRTFTTLARGEVIRVDNVVSKGDGLRLGADSPVTRLALADEPVRPR